MRRPSPKSVGQVLGIGALFLVACADPPRASELDRPESEVASTVGAPSVAAPPENAVQPTPALPSEVAPATAAPTVRLAGGIEVDRAAREVRVPATIALTAGWLEQVVCTTGTREHEALLVVDLPPSQVHAALLMLGASSGSPGRWSLEGDELVVIDPTGDAIEPRVRWREAEPAGDREREAALVEWIRGSDGRAFTGRWVFAGSRIAPNPPSLGPGEHYVADFTGSLIGLVTFGDETIGATVVIPDQVSVEAANWEAWTERMPPEGTPATLVLRLGHESLR